MRTAPERVAALISVLIGSYGVDCVKYSEWPFPFGSSSRSNLGSSVRGGPALEAKYTWPWAAKSAKASDTHTKLSRSHSYKRVLNNEYAWTLDQTMIANPRTVIDRRRMDCIKQRPETSRIVQARSNNAEVHIAYAANREQLYGLLTSMISVARHLSNPSGTIIHLIIEQKDRSIVEALVRIFREEIGTRISAGSALDVKVHTVFPFRVDLTNNSAKPLFQNSENFARFYLPEYMPGARRALWLDCDTIIQSDVAPLFHMELRSVVAAAAEWNIDSEMQAGVFLVDLHRWASGGYTRKIELKAAELLAEGGSFGTQILMNAVFTPGNWDLLDWRWNAFGMASLWDDEYEEDPYGPHSGVRMRLAAEAVLRYCMDSPKILHMNWGPKYFSSDFCWDKKAMWLLPYLPTKETALAELGILPAWRRK